MRFGNHNLATTLLIAAMLLPVVLMGMAGCGDDDDPVATNTLIDPAADLTGTWNIGEVVDATGCDGGISTDNYMAEVTQSGNSLTVVIRGESFTGTISGTTVSWTGSYPDQGGTTTITSMSLTVNPSGDGLTGTANWRWSDDSMSCTGTTAVTGIKI